MIRASLIGLALSLAFTGCSKKEDGTASAKPTEATKAGPTKLPKLGLQIDVPGSVSVGDAVMGEGHMLQGASIGAMQIEIADKKKTIDDAKSDADMYSPKDLKATRCPMAGRSPTATRAAWGRTSSSTSSATSTARRFTARRPAATHRSSRRCSQRASRSASSGHAADVGRVRAFTRRVAKRAISRGHTACCSVSA